MFSHRSPSRSLASTAMLVALASWASAQSERFTYTVNTQYQASGLDAMSPGSTATGKPILIGPTLAIDKAYGGKVSVDIPPIDWGLFTTPGAHFGYLGAEAKLVLNGEAGIRVTPRYSGGKLDYTYNALLTLDMPRYPAEGEKVKIKFSTGAGFSNFHTTSPTFGARFDAVASFDGSIGGSGYFFSDSPFASGTHPFNASPAPVTIGDFDITSGGAKDLVQNILDKVGYQASLANPIPIGISGYVPVLTAGPASVDATGTVNARGFAKFLSLDTSLLDLMLAFIPDGAAKKALEITQGDYMIFGTNYRINWAICKTAANIDVGLDGQYSLRPVNKNVALSIKDSSGNVVALDALDPKDPDYPNYVSFTMPAGGIAITPTLTQDFRFSNRVGINIQGAIGFYPFSGGAKGDLGIDVGANTSVDFQFDVARLEKKFNPEDSASSLIYKTDFDLPKQTDRAHTLPVIGLNTYSKTDLPNELLFAEGPRIANLHAYGEGDDRDYLLLEIQPEQGRQFFIASGSVNPDGSAKNGAKTDPIYASMLYPDGVRSLVTKAFNGQPGGLVVDSANGSKIVLRIPLKYANFAFARGIYDMTLRIATTNGANQAVAKTYRFPLQAYAHNPAISGQFNTRNDLDPQGATFRVTPVSVDANGKPATAITPQKLYFNSNFVLKDTVMLIDNPNDPANPYTIPLDDPKDSGNNPLMTCSITLSNALVQELGGVIHNMQLRTPSTGSKSDGTAYNPALSNVSQLFFIADKPNVASTRVDTGAGFGDAPFWIAVTGSNFAQSTQAFLTDGTGTVSVPVAYGSPTSMRVQVPAAFIQRNHNAGRNSYTLQLTTPPFTTPSNDTAGVYQSGGNSNVVSFNLAYPVPSVESIDQPKVARGLSSLTLHVTGSNLFRYNPFSKATVFSINGNAISPARTFYPAGDGITVPYVEIPVDPNLLTQNGVYQVTATNGTGSGRGATLTVENGAPVLGSLSRLRFRVGPSFAYTPDLYGAPFYKETQFLLNGSVVPLAGLTASDATPSFNYDFLKTIAANVVDLTAFTPKPGGGTSSTIQVTLEEGDSNTVKVVPGALVYDRISDTYRQSIAVTYLGSRDVSRGVPIVFANVGAGVTLVNQTGNAGGNLPYINATLAPRRQVTFVAIWKKTAGSTINSSPAPNFGLSD